MEDGEGPAGAAHHLVEAGGAEAHGRAEQEEADEGGGHEGAAAGGREEAEAGEAEREQRHQRELHARAHQHGEQQRLRRRPEHVAVHQLPAELLLARVLALARVVLDQVLVDGAQQDHGRHACVREGERERTN